MRLLVTADVHFNHPGSRASADDLIVRMNAAGGDGVLLVGDTAVADGDSLEQCLSRFTVGGPSAARLFVAGNHELWTRGPDSYDLFTTTLPARVRAAGWHWLEDAAYRPTGPGGPAVVGTVGWYDYAFAPDYLNIPRRFYEAKVSPGAAERLDEFAHLFDRDRHGDDVPPAARDVVSRWNDGKFVHLRRPDEQFLRERLDGLRLQLAGAADAPWVLAAVHVVPFRELMPPPRNPQWDFAKAYLGSPRIGEMLLGFENVREVYCGHSHFAAEARVGQVRAVNVGSGYRHKTFCAVDVP